MKRARIGLFIVVLAMGADGQVLSENWDHFIVVKDARRFAPPEGISPPPQFKLSLALSREGVPLGGTKERMERPKPVAP